MKLTQEYSSIRIANRRVQATNYQETKDWARDFLQFLTQFQPLIRRLETSTRRYMNNIKEEKNKDKDK
jgi:hypothetical protein